MANPRKRSLIKAGELARRLGVARETISRWRWEGRLAPGVHFVMVGRTPYFIWPAVYETFRPR